jgi:DNA polymerase
MRFICGSCPSFKDKEVVLFDKRKGSLGDCEFFIIGEAPGETEDKQGLPFIGRSGKLLRRMLEENKINSYYITNIVKCRPDNNRKPTKEEILTCYNKYLNLELSYVAHFNTSLKYVITVGRVASDFLIGKGMYKNYEICKSDKFPTLPIIPIHHPAYILRRMSYYEEWKNNLKEIIKKGY